MMFSSIAAVFPIVSGFKPTLDVAGFTTWVSVQPGRNLSVNRLGIRLITNMYDNVYEFYRQAHNKGGVWGGCDLLQLGIGEERFSLPIAFQL